MNQKEVNLKSQDLGFVKTYLMMYSLVQTICWLVIIQRLLVDDFKMLNGKNTSLFESIIYPLTITHLLTFLEVIHAIVNIVPSNLKMTVLQISLRTYVACVVAHVAQHSIGFRLVVHAWAFADVWRYSYYSLHSMKIAPHFLKWLRYSVFIVAIPLGGIGEYLSLFAALVHVMMNGSWHIRIFKLHYITLLNQYILYILWIVSVPILLRIYVHLLKQRKLVLGNRVIQTAGEKHQ